MHTDIPDLTFTKEQQEAGFWLCEDEDFLYVYCHGELLNILVAKEATPQTIRKETDRHLKPN